MIIKEALSLDDVLLEPCYSDISSRSDVDLSVKIGNFSFMHPIVNSNMLHIATENLLIQAINFGGLATLHRFMPIEEQLNIFNNLKRYDPDANYFAFSVGIKQEDRDNCLKFAAAGAKIVCIDIAHGDSKHCVDMVKWIKDNLSEMFVIAGNVATGGGARRLWEAGADVVKTGVGSGSICLTRINAAAGVPQFTALADVSSVRQELSYNNPNKKYYIMADGGCKSPGDLVKCLALADFVMCGNIFAGCQETTTKLFVIDGVQYAEYAGSSTLKSNHVEGVEALVPVKGKYSDILNTLLQGVRSGCSYQGSRNLQDLKENPVFVKITHAGIIESGAHDVKVTK